MSSTPEFGFKHNPWNIFSGCNPNTQTAESEVLKTQAAARKMEYKKKCEEARHRIIMLEKSKAMKRVKEIKEQREKDVKKQQQQQQMKKQEEIAPSNPFEEEESNPFLSDSDPMSPNEGSNPFEEDMNPFLQEDTGEWLFDDIISNLVLLLY